MELFTKALTTAVMTIVALFTTVKSPEPDPRTHEAKRPEPVAIVRLPKAIKNDKTIAKSDVRPGAIFSPKAPIDSSKWNVLYGPDVKVRVVIGDDAGRSR